MAKAVNTPQDEVKEEKKMTKSEATKIVDHYANIVLTKDPADLVEAKKVLGIIK